ncbi:MULTISPECIES: DUF2891 domain-containing protein [unclassified Lysobacter]|uniref:DUF2891 domain-containing protein n=1 Tax=unclassified Lysobacter TaxID=2635362 RepID=UPI0006FF75C7|nr:MULTISPECIES: DUF2891 domain-containing protein [unclassified Lysobacter]KQZ57726.1 hypothetical protein ASD53_08930 [Lysobacter sp. Root559]KRA74386.1 hypothetical protein ASD78_12965 [Lysobacter sp. Root667]KRC33874.1 hypothetical protein ASE10_13090 [Lysobacter sp. Root76]KRD69210.1 hypothetical protein ASE45_08530 [Lysobacter sp. Root96]
MGRGWMAVALWLCAASAWAQAPATLDEARAAHFAKLALDCVQREYPNKLSHQLRSDADALPPRKLYPAFYGCYDWHSSVHGHWLLVRLLQRYPNAAFAQPARQALAANLTAANIAGELAYLRTGGDESFERPYGLAWLLQLGTQLRGWDDPQGRQWAAALEPLEREASARFLRWLPKLTMPIRVGEHSQTAFAFGLALDWSERSGDARLRAALSQRVREFHLGDRDCPIAYEPSGQDFLSPCLAEADLMRRVLAPAEYARWLKAFLPRIPRKADAGWLTPGVVLDPTDGKLAHLDGLNLSRAWMLEGMARGLPPGDRRIPALRAAAARHRDSGLTAVSDAHYAGAHWLGSFATYLLAPPET